VLRGLAVSSLVLAAACQDTSDPMRPDEAPAATVIPDAAQDRISGWFARSWPEVLALPGTVLADHDEANNRMVFGVENAAAIPAVRAVLARLGVPEDAWVVQVTEPIHQLVTLRDRFRPTQAGIQIHFGQYVCTMGFNVDHAGGRSFITNSHCTNRQGGTEGTLYYQPTSTVDPTAIATEAADPAYFKGGVCPKGKSCRYSDSSRALYSGSALSSRGVIAKTTGANNGSLTVAGEFAITSQDNTTTSFGIGTTVNKVGRTTGWTQGPVTSTCVNVNVSGSKFTQLCQTIVTSSSSVLVGGGDSGSGVFRITSGDNVQLVGILWGGSSDGRTFVFSPLKSIQDELGAVTATK
jgi:hypothetical protein